MAYFRCGGGSGGGAKVYLDGKEIEMDEVKFYREFVTEKSGDVKYGPSLKFPQERAIIYYDGYVHLIGGPNYNDTSWDTSSVYPRHYKVPINKPNTRIYRCKNLPIYSYSNPQCFVYNDLLHILVKQNYDSPYKKVHYTYSSKTDSYTFIGYGPEDDNGYLTKYSGTTHNNNGISVINNGSAYIFAGLGTGDNSYKHKNTLFVCKYTTSNGWEVSQITLPTENNSYRYTDYSVFVVMKGKIYMIGGSYNSSYPDENKQVYIIDPDNGTLTLVTMAPDNFEKPYIMGYADKYLISGNKYTNAYADKTYLFDGNTFTLFSNSTIGTQESSNTYVSGWFQKDESLYLMYEKNISYDEEYTGGNYCFYRKNSFRKILEQ